MDFYGSYMGMFIIQSLCHSAVAAAVADSSILAWKTTDPMLKQRLRLLVILLPIFSFPIYQTISPDRGSMSFRLNALFDTERWLTLELWGRLPLWPLFVLLLFFTALVFLLQEMIPIIRHTMEARKPPAQAANDIHDSSLNNALDNLNAEGHDILIIDDEEPLLFSSTGKNPSIYLSTGLIKELNGEQLEAAVAHEIAHIKRSKRPMLIIMFIFRMLMFFNPVTLIEFRKVVQEEEKICDDIAVAMTGKPKALAGAISRLRPDTEGLSGSSVKKPSDIFNALEQFSHDMLLQSRIFRLENASAGNPQIGRFQFIVTLGATISINYFIV